MTALLARRALLRVSVAAVLANSTWFMRNRLVVGVEGARPIGFSVPRNAWAGVRTGPEWQLRTRTW